MSEASGNGAGGRLMLRLTSECNSACAHCTIADIRHHPDKNPQEALREIKRGRSNGCTELVLMRGEPTLYPQLLSLVQRARQMGYDLVQLQTNGRTLASERYLMRLLQAGVTFFEVSLFGHVAPLHDAVDGTEDAFKQVVAGIRNLVKHDCAFLVTVPILKRNYLVLPQIAKRANHLGAQRIQFNFSRPVRIGEVWKTAPLVRLEEAGPWIRLALTAARGMGMTATTEAVPLCHLGSEDRSQVKDAVALSECQVVDLHRSESSMVDHHAEARPKAPECAPCVLAHACPTTWAAYQSLFGTWELVPFLAQE